MKKEEFLAIGVPEDKVKEASDRWHKELRELAAAAASRDSKTAIMLRGAISAMLPTIKSVTELRRILRATSTAYYMEDRDREERKKA